MKKIEWVYREILYQAMENEKPFLKQTWLSKTCRISIGNVNKALKPLENINCIEKKPRGFLVIQPKKILTYWASIRNLQKDIVFRTHVNKNVNEIEKELPPVMFTAYSSYKFRFKSIPSEYSEVIVYGDPRKIKERFETVKGVQNLIVLKQDPHLLGFKEVPIAQLYVDLWNLNTWYANDFLKALEEKIKVV